MHNYCGQAVDKPALRGQSSAADGTTKRSQSGGPKGPSLGCDRRPGATPTGQRRAPGRGGASSNEAAHRPANPDHCESVPRKRVVHGREDPRPTIPLTSTRVDSSGPQAPNCRTRVRRKVTSVINVGIDLVNSPQRMPDVVDPPSSGWRWSRRARPRREFNREGLSVADLPFCLGCVSERSLESGCGTKVAEPTCAEIAPLVAVPAELIAG